MSAAFSMTMIMTGVANTGGRAASLNRFARCSGWTTRVKEPLAPGGICLQACPPYVARASTIPNKSVSTDADFAELKKHYTDAQIVDIVAVISLCPELNSAAAEATVCGLPRWRGLPSTHAKFARYSREMRKQRLVPGILVPILNARSPTHHGGRPRMKTPR